MEKILNDLGTFEREATAFVTRLMPHAESATLVTLSGELGAGKTAFVKAVAKALGVTEVVTSPTFVLEKIYALPAASRFTKLVHIDAYRLEKGDTLAPLRFDELMTDSKNLIMLEWPERVSEALPKAMVTISIEVLPGGGRKITYG